MCQGVHELEMDEALETMKVPYDATVVLATLCDHLVSFALEKDLNDAHSASKIPDPCAPVAPWRLVIHLDQDGVVFSEQ